LPFDIRVEPEAGAVSLSTTTADFMGTLTWPVAIQPGFSAIYVQTNIGGPTPVLLKRHVLRL
jgi:hypothetical protein